MFFGLFVFGLAAFLLLLFFVELVEEFLGVGTDLGS